MIARHITLLQCPKLQHLLVTTHHSSRTFSMTIFHCQSNICNLRLLLLVVSKVHNIFEFTKRLLAAVGHHSQLQLKADQRILLFMPIYGHIMFATLHFFQDALRDLGLWATLGPVVNSETLGAQARSQYGPLEHTNLALFFSIRGQMANKGKTCIF